MPDRQSSISEKNICAKWLLQKYLTDTFFFSSRNVHIEEMKTPVETECEKSIRFKISKIVTSISTRLITITVITSLTKIILITF